MLWKNELTENGMPLGHLLPVDVTVHWADPEGWPSSGVPVVTHLHGGHTESDSDGLPDQWFTPGFALTGPGFAKETYMYDNDQEAATLWYHDHALGITRLNVYAGLAGFYLLRDDNEDALVASGNLPTGPYEVEIVIQDRMFYEDGELYYPAEPEEEGQPEPSVLPEFFGDFILVNGAAWPVLDVEPRQYRFRLLDGSDSRFYDLRLKYKFDGGPGAGRKAEPTPPIYQIGTDNGLLEAPVPMERILIGPGERADIVVDFSDPTFWSKTYVFVNSARSPFPKGETPEPRTSGQIMAFRVTKPLDPAFPPTTLPATLRPLHGPIEPLMQTGTTRKLILFEGTDEYGRLKPMLGTVEDGALEWAAPITENPMLGDVEVWEVYNGTEDAHPIHLHLVSFQIISRQKFKADQDPETGALSNIKLIGRPMPPSFEEAGWKDTAIMYPGEVTKVIAKFDREGLYVWHCHILSHEDHEMMRPYYVGPMAMAAQASEVGPRDAEAGSPRRTNPAALSLLSNYPNPFSPRTTVRFELSEEDFVRVDIYNVLGQRVRTLASDIFPAGQNELLWDGRNDRGELVSDGVYYCEARSSRNSLTRRMLLLRH